MPFSGDVLSRFIVNIDIRANKLILGLAEEAQTARATSGSS